MPVTPEGIKADQKPEDPGGSTPEHVAAPKTKVKSLPGIAELSATPAGRRALRRIMVKTIFFS